MSRTTTMCDFCMDDAHYITPDSAVAFCYWHTLLYFLGYTYMVTA